MAGVGETNEENVLVWRISPRSPQEETPDPDGGNCMNEKSRLVAGDQINTEITQYYQQKLSNNLLRTKHATSKE